MNEEEAKVEERGENERANDKKNNNNNKIVLMSHGWQCVGIHAVAITSITFCEAFS